MWQNITWSHSDFILDLSRVVSKWAVQWEKEFFAFIIILGHAFTVEKTKIIVKLSMLVVYFSLTKTILTHDSLSLENLAIYFDIWW